MVPECAGCRGELSDSAQDTDMGPPLVSLQQYRSPLLLRMSQTLVWVRRSRESTHLRERREGALSKAPAHTSKAGQAP